MKSSLARFFDFRLLAVCALLSICAPASAVTIDWVTVGNAGNTGNLAGVGTVWGAKLVGGVNYEYRIGTYEVTNSQYVEFLNAVDPTGANSLGLYSAQMTANASGGINFSAGNANGSKYSIKSGRDANPVIFVDFYDALRFTNWANNGFGNSSTESGAYTLLGNTPVPSNATTIARTPGASIFLPSEDEWYKAAYHKNDGVTANYWLYATKADVAPYSDNPLSINTPTPSNTGNVFQDDGDYGNGYNDGYALTGIDYPDDLGANALTNVGAYTAALSPYGTFDQGDNVKEWNDTIYVDNLNNVSASLVGGNWANGANAFDSSLRFFGNPQDIGDTYNNVGFRLAGFFDVVDPGPGGGNGEVPEPSTLLISVLGALSAIQLRRRARRAGHNR